MDFLTTSYKNTGSLHHAYIVEGEREAVRNFLVTFLESDVGVVTQGNPDFWYGEFETFTIDDSRLIAEREKNKSFSDSRKIFIIAARSFTSEAQNSLLKIFEEPTAGTHFFLILPQGARVLPTVRSRVIHIVHEDSKNTTEEAEHFLKLSYKKRLEFVGEIIEEKNKEKASNLLSGLERHLREKKPLQSLNREEVIRLEEVSKLRSYLGDRSPSLKLILEHLALVL